MTAELYKFRCRREGYYQDILTKPKISIINDAPCQDLGMFIYCMIMHHHLHQSLCSILLRRRRLPSCHTHHTLLFFLFPKHKQFLIGCHPDTFWFSHSSVCLNQRPWRNKFRNWNYVFQTAENIFFIRVKCFWDILQYTLHIDQPS